MGAGAIGGYVGVRAAAAGLPTIMVGRTALNGAQDTLSAYDLDGNRFRPQAGLQLTSDASALAHVDLCILATKSKDTIEAGTVLKSILSANVPVVSLQNGLDNPSRLRTLGFATVVPGLVTFNVVKEENSFRQTTSGPIVTENAGHHPALQALATGLRDVPWALVDDLRPKQAGKLLLNLNNGICAASGVTVATSLKSRKLRIAFAQCIREGLRVFARAEQPVERLGRLSPSVIARLLGLPDFLFYRAARQMIRVDPRAKSSTLQDLERGRPTEIDDLNGAIVRLGEQHGVATPANRYITETIKALEGASEPKHPSIEEVYANTR